ncbi:uncharacterized protein PG986_008731 [Apiospora aurea]|uniref:Uncharacterized protein n=1 Tax=Apiospora aurea TaxID=335848 RepID=A0ABR1Q5X5_9PEZI
MFVPLDDAKAVNPKVPHTQCTGYLNRIPKGSWQVVEADLAETIFKRFFGGKKRLCMWWAPAVAECAVFSPQPFAFQKDQVLSRWVAQVENTGRQFGTTVFVDLVSAYGSLARFVLEAACFQPCTVEARCLCGTI